MSSSRGGPPEGHESIPTGRLRRTSRIGRLVGGRGEGVRDEGHERGALG
jgi:hypothetical protein